ncbi:MAG: flagellar hook-associated protein FlgL [Lachnospiraceae bacterium]|nr:flagellar hook-associated protein FlgL [Lachnospiraceae bacterium]
MRVTNRMMTNNLLYNINGNKNSLSGLEQQYATGMRIQRPSEDPIIAVRALKLRTNLSELNQYYEKNIPDAMSWMDVTESALKVVNSILTQVHTYCVQGSTDTLTADDRASIVKNLNELKGQIYQEGDTNYAGRYVFTGYKTDTSLVFDESQENEKYTITEPLKGTDIDIIKKAINDCDLKSYDPETSTEADYADNPEKPNMINAYRIRLAYDELDKAEDGGELSIRFGETDEDGEVTYTDFNMGAVTEMLSTDANAYQVAEDEVHYLTDTGELIIGSELYNEWRVLENIEITYDKTSFEKNDLRPEHYFNCDVTSLNEEGEPDDTKEVLHYTKQNQEISYEVNFGQKLVINTQGSDAIQHAIGRTIDGALNAVNDVIKVEEKIAEINKMLENEEITAEQEGALKAMLALAEDELTLKSEVMQDTFSKALTEIEQQQDVVNVAVADLGSRYVRLQLTESRLSDEQTDFEELLSSNEDADMVETIINYQAMQTVYNASLNAASKSLQTTLLDFL